MSKIDALKDPILKEKVQNYIDNPSGDALKELTEQDMNALSGAFNPIDFLSKWMGNNGKYCTVTKECTCR